MIGEKNEQIMNIDGNNYEIDASFIIQSFLYPFFIQFLQKVSWSKDENS